MSKTVLSHHKPLGMTVSICKLFKYIDTVYQLSLIVIHTQLKKQICYTNIFLDRKKLLVSENIKSSKTSYLLYTVYYNYLDRLK